MLFSAIKDRSLTLLKFVMALFIVVAPTLFGFSDIELSACILFILIGFLFVVRMRKTGQGHISICQFVMMTLLFYSIVSVLWADNRNGHCTYILMISSLTMFFGLVTDYLNGNNDEKIQRRMMYMISLGGALCALWNFIYWVVALIPYGKNDCFSEGIGSSDFLAVFMLLCIIITYKLIGGNRPARKIWLVINMLLMIFVFIMTKSSGWFLLLVFTVMFLVTRKTKKFFVPMTLVFAGLFLIFVIIFGSGSVHGTVFKDVFRYGAGNLFGHGGGFWSAREMLSNGKIDGFEIPGLLAFLCASSGIIGLLSCIAMAGRVVFQFLRLKSWASAANVFITVMILFFPLAQSPVPLFLWVGLIAYNEKDANLSKVRTYRPDTVKATTCIIAVAGVLAVTVMGQIFIKINALHKYEDKNYIEAYELYNTAATINPMDGESCRMAAKSLYMSESIKERYTEALMMADKAQKRDRYNLENMHIKAQIYYKCEMYDLSYGEYSALAFRVEANDRYNLEAVKSLYNIIRTKEKGSTEAKEIYDKMTDVAGKTRDLDYKEKINNIVDKALVYTKGELTVEK